MSFVADESVDRQIVERLRLDGHVVLAVAEMVPGISDETVLDLAKKQKALLLTADNDFGDLVFRQRLLTSGVILLRLAGVPAGQKAAIVSSCIGEHATRLVQAFTVVTPAAVRIRRRVP